MSSNKPRPYQEKALTQIRNEFEKGNKKVLLHMSTGGGKTLTFCCILAGIQKKNKKGIVVVKGRDLVENASNRLTRENVNHGVLMSGHWKNLPHENIQVCSVDTLFSRKLIPDADILIIDEAQDATSNKYKWLIEQYKDKYILGVSATPHVKTGLKHIADVVVRPITINELIEQGYLVRPRYYAPSKINLSGISIDKKTGDYKIDELEKVMDDVKIYGDLVENYRRYAFGRKAIVFCVSIAHSKSVCEYLNSNGIRAAHVDASSSRSDRDMVIKQIENDEIDVVCNVNLFSVGVDIPIISCIIHARPTKSYNFWIQSNGRATRPFANKNDFIVLDHVGNISEHGLIEDERECLLEGWKQDIQVESVTNCERCFSAFSPRENYSSVIKFIFDSNEKEFIEFYNSKDVNIKYGDRAFRSKRLYFCLECGYNNTQINEAKEQNTEVGEDKLKEISEHDKLMIKAKTRHKELKKIKKAKGYKRGWIKHIMVAEFGVDIANLFVNKIKLPKHLERFL